MLTLLGPMILYCTRKNLTHFEQQKIKMSKEKAAENFTILVSDSFERA
jgi:hypothetical protein